MPLNAAPYSSFGGLTPSELNQHANLICVGMPGARTACERCRRRKARCVWPDGLSAPCARCQEDKQPCELSSRQSRAPTRQRVSSSNQPDFVSAGITRVDDDGGQVPIALDQRLRRLEDVLARLPTVPPAPAYADNQEGIRGHNGRLDFPAAVARAEPDLSNHSGNPLVSDSELSSNVMDFDCDVPSEAERHSLVNSASASVVPSLVAAQGGPAGSTDVPEFASLPRCFLPTTREGISLLETYFHDFNTKIPLLSPLAIVTHLRDCYDGTAAGIPESWVLTYITFGIAHRMRAMSSSSTSEDSTMADFYMSKCLWTLAELLLGEPRLQLVQCLLGVAILLQTSDKSHRAASYTSIAMRMVQDLAYNEEQDDDESREKGYSFWIAFFMDNDLALSKSRPSSQRLADISIPLPGAADQDWWGPRDQSHSNTEGSINVFALHASLAVIQAEISEELFSARARKIGNIPAAYTDICSKLLYWRRSSELLTLDPLVLSQRSNRSDLIHLVFLEASYFRTVFHVYASQALGSFNTAIDVISPDSFRALAPIGLPACIEDAQRLLSWMVLMSYETLSWATTHAMLAAIFTVLSWKTLAHERGRQDYARVLHTSSYAGILSGLEAAAAESKDTVLRESAKVCRRFV